LLVELAVGACGGAEETFRLGPGARPRAVGVVDVALPARARLRSRLTKNSPRLPTGVGQKSSAAEFTGSPRFVGAFQGTLVEARVATQMSSPPIPPGRFEAMKRLRPSGDWIGHPSTDGVFTSAWFPAISSIFWDALHAASWAPAATAVMPTTIVAATDSALVEGLAASSLMMLENAHLVEELGASRARLVTAADRERRKVERDLHDGAQQRLIAIQIQLRLVEERIDDRELAARLDAVGTQAQEAIEELRALAHGIYPPVLQSFGLVDALRACATTAQTPTIDLIDEGIGRCSPTVEAAIYFCAMEAVQNATKHAGSQARVTITLGRDRERVRFAVADDGVGMDNPSATDGDGHGLTSMRDRIGAVSGELEITSTPGRGTTIRATVPDSSLQ
jgi:signal transduction histidine kinase